MPFFSRLPGGGIKIMYQLANLLVDKGYEVKIYYNLCTKYTYPKTRPLIIRRLLAKYYHGDAPKPQWFKLKENIQSCYVNGVTDSTIDDGDIVLYTWWALGFDIEKLDISKGKKFNLIQGYEIWGGLNDLVHQSYSLSSVINVCIADYLVKIVSAYSARKVENILLSVDSFTFYLDNKISQRRDDSIIMLYSDRDNIKGSNYALEAFENLKKDFPDLQVSFFGVVKRQKRIPKWIKYYFNPSNLANLYNSNAIFLSPSLTEGWALPPVEAMKCGCAFVGTDIAGHDSYLIEEFAVSVQPRDSNAIYLALKNLILNHHIRVKIATNGNEYVKKFTWENTITQLDDIFKKYM